MSFPRNGMLTLAAIAFVIMVCGCNALALSGFEKYKVDLNGLLLKIKSEIDTEGKVSTATVGKLDKFLDQRRKEFGMKGSFGRTERVQEYLHDAAANEAEAFRNYQMCKNEIAEILEMLKTEQQK